MRNWLLFYLRRICVVIHLSVNCLVAKLCPDCSFLYPLESSLRFMWEVQWVFEGCVWEDWRKFRRLLVTQLDVSLDTLWPIVQQKLM